jgi:TonB family protein
MTVHQWLAEASSWGWPMLANHLWQATLISLVSFAAAGFLKKGPGRARYVVWMIASVRFMLPSALLVSIAHLLGIDFSSLFASSHGSGEAATVVFQLTAPIIQLDGSGRTDAYASNTHSELFCALTIVWLSGSAILIARWLKRRRRFRIAICATPLAEASRERQALDRVRSWMGIDRKVDLAMLPGTVEPGVWGMWRPIVFLPERLAEELSEAELEAVLMHEMIHVQRWDNLVANLHRLLCCVFWFNPVVWVLDRLLLAERERACDDEVIRLGGAPAVYASSLLKVLRFCLGWSVAGASNATGSNLGRRVERIMSRNVQVKLSVWNRLGIVSIVTLVIVLSMAAGLFTRSGFGAQTRKPNGGVIGGIPGGVPGGVIGGIPGGVPGGVVGDPAVGSSDFTRPEEQEDLIQRLEQASETQVDFRNSAKAPARITDAKVRAVPREKDGRGNEFAVIPIITLSNNSDRTIKGVTLEFRNGIQRRGYFLTSSALLPGGATHTLKRMNGQKRFLVLVGEPNLYTVRLVGVLFENGEVWGRVPPPPPPPPPPSAELRKLEWAPETTIRFNNRDHAPVTITSATVKAARVEWQQAAGDTNSEERYLIKLAVQLVNNTARRITALGIGYPTDEPNPPSDWMRTYASVKIEPHESYRLETPQPESPGYGAFYFRGNPERMEARVIGVKFEDGEEWGSFPETHPLPPPPPPQAISTPDDRKLIRKSGGVLANSATHRVVPESPPLARAARITGSVVVEVTIDEGGSVIAARAISGHPLLKDTAVEAARQWQFTPTNLSGVPVKVIGLLTFQFEP